VEARGEADDRTEELLIDAAQDFGRYLVRIIGRKPVELLYDFPERDVIQQPIPAA
jgi:hypothetical protein